MTGLLNALYLLSLCLWVGGLVFHSLLGVPRLSRALGKKRVLAWMGYACGGVGLLALLFLWQVDETGSLGNWLQLLLGMLALAAFLDLWIGPRLKELEAVLESQDSPVLRARLHRLRRLSASLHYGLVGLGVLLILFTSQRLRYY